MSKLLTAVVVSAGLFISTPAMSRQVEVEITNLTNGVYFTPLLVAAHKRGTDLFEAGTVASANLEAMAEGGDISGLVKDVDAAGGDYVANPAGGLLAPGESVTTRLHIGNRRNTRLSITAMVLPSNDAFVGLDAMKIPRWHGSQTRYVFAYDAGTEANDELSTSIPAIPGEGGGVNGTGVVDSETDQNQTVHVHRGIVGDLNPVGGASDLHAGIHRFNNPVARVVVKVR
ncbi:MAG: hypothetical protein GY703_05475 [Gammaproteobacteria bacterium]|nr:hypothetical protein [Gammaproteobacteria bacterium]